MTSRPVLSQRFTSDSPHEVGKECDFWKKFGEYAHQQAINDGWLDAQEKLTPAGLQIIISEQELIKRREELTRSPKLKSGGLKGKFKIKWLHLPISSSPRIGMKTKPSFRTKKHAKSEFVDEVKTLLSKISGTFVHYKDDRLVVRIPSEKGVGTTSKSFTGSVSDIRRDLNKFLDEIEENILRKQHR